MKLKGNEKILIVRHDRLGDLVLTLPIAWALKQVYPDLMIEILTSQYNSYIIKYADYVDRPLIADFNNKGNIAVGDLVSKMTRNNYNIVIFAKPDLRIAFAAYLAGIPLRLGTSRRAYSLLFNVRVDLPRRRSLMHEVDLNLKLIEHFGLAFSPNKVWPILSASNEKSKLHVIPDDRYIVIHPGSKGSAANWPSENYRRLILELSKLIKVIITGQDGIEIEHNENIINLINKTDFAALIDVINSCSLFISGSTGPLHIAAALGRPVIGLYPDHPVLGPHRWGPRGKIATAIAPDKQTGHKCRINIDGSCECMKKIKVETVKQAALDILKTTESIT